MKHAFRLGDEEFELGLSRAADGYRLHRDGRELAVLLSPGEEGGWVLRCGDAVDHLAVAVDGDRVWVHLNGETHCLEHEHPLQRLAEMLEGAADDQLRATMPGSVVALHVATGDTVSKGQDVLVMESMKMETTLHAPRDGVIAAVHVEAGQTFDKDAVLVTLQSDTDA